MKLSRYSFQIQMGHARYEGKICHLFSLILMWAEHINGTLARDLKSVEVNRD